MAKEPHGAYHLADNPNLFEPQRSNNFEFIVTGLDRLLRAGALGTEENAYFENTQEYIRLAVKKAFIPHFTQGVEKIKRGNTEMKFAGTMSFDSGTVDVTDYIGAETVDRLVAWQALSGDINKETVGLMSAYKKDAYLVEYTPDYSKKVRTWKLKGCWISKLSESDVDTDGTGARRITATIEFDKAVIDVTDLT